MSNGTLWAWGRNDSGQIGDGSIVASRPAPVQVSGIGNVIAVAGGVAHTVALRSNGTVYTWGDNSEGQLGLGNNQAKTVPTQVPNLGNVVAIAAGFGNTWALKSDGTVWGWGYGPLGALGTGNTDTALSPVQVRNATGIVGIAGGADHLLLLRNDGVVFAVGDNHVGQLGDGSATNRGAPAQFIGISNGTNVVAGGKQTYLMRSDGAVFGIGANDAGQLGNGTTEGSGTPVRAAGMTGAKVIASGFAHIACVMQDGSMMSWGDNTFGQLGTGNTNGRTGPGAMPGMGGMTAVASGFYHSIALKSDGTVFAWGRNDHGQLGDGSLTDRTSPFRVPGLGNVIAVAAGGYHSLALKSDGTVWAWGWNQQGQLGDGTRTDRSVPTQVGGLTGVTAIAGGGVHSVALRSDKTVRTWGGNGTGQLGDGTTVLRTSPITPVKVFDIQQIAAGGFMTYARRGDGSVVAWGRGGMAGHSNEADTLLPTVMPFLKDVKSLSSSLDHTVAMTNEGRMFAWGSNIGQELAIPFAQFTTTIGRVKDPLTSRSTTAPALANGGMVRHKAAPGSFDSADIVIEFFNATIKNGAQTSGIGHYFLTAEQDEAASIDAGGSGPGWQRTGRVFRAWKGDNVQNAPANAVPVCRFYGLAANSHFFTANPQECQDLKNPASGWRSEGIAFYAVLPQNGVCTPGFYPVYRSYNNRFVPNQPAQNDGNHRITPSYIDYQRSIRFFGFADEGVAFCTPASTDSGGDVQTANVYPGAEVVTGSPIQAEYVFANNGPGRSDFGMIYMALPTNVPDWVVTCVSKNGAVCPQNLNPDRLREGQQVLTWPAGGILTLTANGTAPAVQSGADATLEFATATARGNGAPDPTSENDAPPRAQTVVRGNATCNYTLNPTGLSFSASASTVPVRLVARSGCAWAAQSDAPWLSPGTPSGNGNSTLQVSVQPNPSSQPRTGTLAVGGSVVAVTQAGTIPPQNPDDCISLRLQRSGDQMPASGLSGPTSLGVFADKQCGWEAKSNAPWITMTAGGAGNGNGTVSYMAQPNEGGYRSALISIGDKNFSVNQLGTDTGPSGGGNDGGGDSGGSSGGDSGGSSGGDSG
jgi:alpha-tubulin suppressor-like RCC1 family protein